MQNIGEEIVGEYLKLCKNCDFVDYNISTLIEKSKNRTKGVKGSKKKGGKQGEIDVIGINIEDKIVYVCEVAVHLETGLQYVGSDKRPNNVKKLTAKFEKDIDYAGEQFSHEYKIVPMLWSPIVKNQKDGALYNQMKDVKDIINNILTSRKILVIDVINEKFDEALKELREEALNSTKEHKSNVVRFMQIEGKLEKHLEKKAIMLIDKIQ